MTVALGRVVPTLRIFDVAKAKEFYVGYLGFKVDWEHGAGEGLPLYMQVARGPVLLHLSEHHGDACPGSAIRIEVAGLDELLAELRAKDYRYYRPGIEDTPWGAHVMTVGDPFGNRIHFDEARR